MPLDLEYVNTQLLNQLATVTAESDGVDKRATMRRTLQALSVLRVIGSGWMWKHALQSMAQGNGRCFQAGLVQPTDDVG